MEEKELITLWKTYDKKLEDNLTLNKKNLEDITRIKVKSLLSSMKPIKIFAVVLGILWVIFVDSLVIDLFETANAFFLISAGLQAFIIKLAIGIYLYQIIIINRVNISDPILDTQIRIAKIKSTSIWVTKILFLQLPLWATFYLNKSIFENAGIYLYILISIKILLFTFASIWLYRNIKFENSNKKWFKLLFNGKEWTPIIKSLQMIEEIKVFRNEES